MKIRILAIVAIMLFVIGINAAAVENTFDITVDDGYHYAHRGQSVSEIAAVVGVSEAELSAEFSKGGLLYFAVAPDNSVRIRLSSFADNFSVEAVDMSCLDENNMNKFLSTLGEKTGTEAKFRENGGRKYAVICETLNGDKGEYTVTQYITVCGGKTYYLSCYNIGNRTSDTVESVFKSLEIKEAVNTENTPDWLSLSIGVGITVFAVIAVITAIGLIRSIKIKEN